MWEGLSRRDFMKTGAAGVGALALAMLTGGCEVFEMTTRRIRSRPMRRNIATLSPTDPIIETYKEAVSRMQALPSSDPRNWTRQAQIHLNHCPHGNWFFLPWHRVYIYQFEEICREVTGNDAFALPYWNWSTSPSVPSVFWGAGNPLVDANRFATQTSVADPGQVGMTVLEDILNEPNFLVFGSGVATTQRQFSTTGRLEGTPHNYIHNFVGGDMATYMSPLDPVFWSHHNMVECCWVNWNIVRGHPNTNDSGWTNFTFSGDFVDRHGNPVTVRVLDTLLYPIFLYQYEECFPTRAGAPAGRELAHRDLQQFLQRGARIGLDFVETFELREALELEVGGRLTRTIPLRREALRPLFVPDKAHRLLLTVGGVKVPHGSDFYVRVFVGKPDASPQTPIDDPHYAGSFAVFDGGEGHGDLAANRFLVDLSGVVKRLQASGQAETGLDVQLVAVPYADRRPEGFKMRVESLQLGVSPPLKLE